MARHSEENSQGEHECTRRQLADPKLPNLLQTSPMSIYLRILHFQVQDRNRELAITVQQQQQQQQLKPTEPSLTCRLCVLHTILSLQHCGTGYHDPSLLVLSNHLKPLSSVPWSSLFCQSSIFPPALHSLHSLPSSCKPLSSYPSWGDLRPWVLHRIHLALHVRCQIVEKR